MGAIGAIFWVLPGELFPTDHQATGSGVGAIVDRLADFLVSLLFLPVIEVIGQGPTFWVFSAICLARSVFVVEFVPETQNRDNETVSADLRARWGCRTTDGSPGRAFMGASSLGA